MNRQIDIHVINAIVELYILEYEDRKGLEVWQGINGRKKNSESAWCLETQDASQGGQDGEVSRSFHQIEAHGARGEGGKSTSQFVMTGNDSARLSDGLPGKKPCDERPGYGTTLQG